MLMISPECLLSIKPSIGKHKCANYFNLLSRNPNLVHHLMPKIFQYLGYIIRFYTNDHLPIHVHVGYQVKKLRSNS